MYHNNSDGDYVARLFKLSNDRFGPHPDLRSDSVNLRHRFYTTTFRCSTCDISSLRYTISDKCILCQRIRIEIVRYYARYSDDDVHIVPWPEHVDDKFCTMEFMKELNEARLLIRDEKLILHSEPCSKHGHVRLIGHSDNYNCYYCGQMGTTRDEAIKAGHDEYVPTGKCGGCKKLTIRNTDDKSCTVCHHTPVTNEDTPDVIMMRNDPDMIISKVDADEYGFKVYRTGKECNKGHAGWRYVSTGNCITCIKGE